jgi:type III restriction enzyme
MPPSMLAAMDSSTVAPASLIKTKTTTTLPTYLLGNAALVFSVDYPMQKFDSDTERRFAVILERDALKWFKPAKGQFQIYYKLGTEQPEYVPDFVAEIANKIFMVETKARADIDTQEVQAKAAAAVRWCKHASDHAASVGSKPWHYLLVPHDSINESRRLTDFLASTVS